MASTQDVKLLREKIDEKGLRYGYLADKLGITKTSFSAKLTGKRYFNYKEALELSSILNLDNDDIVDIFF